MIIGDMAIAAILQEELDELRGDQRAIADLFSQAPPAIQERARRYFMDPEHNPITIRQGFLTEPPKNPMIVITLAGEQEEYTPIGGHVGEGPTPDTDLSAIQINYEGLNTGEITIDKAAEKIYATVNRPGSNQPIPSEQFNYSLTSVDTLQLLVDAINTNPVYSAIASTAFAERPPVDLQGGQYGFKELIPVLPSDWDKRSATYFRATWLISILSTNVNETLWIHTFVKWALLRRRIDLELEGIGGAQLSGGDFEPASEWLKNWPNVFVRGVMLSGLYSADYVDRMPMSEVKYADVHLSVPPSYLE